MTDYTEVGFDNFLERGLKAGELPFYDDGSVDASALGGEAVRMSNVHDVEVTSSKLSPAVLSGFLGNSRLACPLFIDSNNYAYIALYENGGAGFGNASIGVYFSKNSGTTWTRRGSLISPPTFSSLQKDSISIAVDSNNLIGVAYEAIDTVNYPNNYNYFFSIYDPSGSSWSTPQAISTNGVSSYGTPTFNSLIVDSSNCWHLSWSCRAPQSYHVSGSLYYSVLFYNKRSSGVSGGWGTMMGVTDGLSEHINTMSSPVIDSNGYVHLIYSRSYITEQDSILIEYHNKVGSWTRNVGSVSGLVYNALVDSNDKIYIYAGTGGKLDTVDSNGKWATTPAWSMISNSGLLFQVSIYSNNDIYIVGDLDGYSSSHSCQKYDSSTDSWGTVNNIYEDQGTIADITTFPIRRNSAYYVESREGKHVVKTLPT